MSRRLRHRQHAKALSAGERTAPPPSRDSAQPSAKSQPPDLSLETSVAKSTVQPVPLVFLGDPSDAWEQFSEMLDL